MRRREEREEVGDPVDPEWEFRSNFWGGRIYFNAIYRWNWVMEGVGRIGTIVFIITMMIVLWCCGKVAK